MQFMHFASCVQREIPKKLASKTTPLREALQSRVASRLPPWGSPFSPLSPDLSTLRQNRIEHPPVDVGQPDVAAAVAEG